MSPLRKRMAIALRDHPLSAPRGTAPTTGRAP